MDNSTDAGAELGYKVFYYISLYAIDIVCLTGNSLIIHSVISNKKLRTIGNISILSLAFSDIIQGFIFPFYNILHIEGVKITVGACSWFIFIVTGPQTVSAYNLVSITLVRYFAVSDPLHYKQRFSHRKRAAFLVFVWTYGLLSTLIIYVIADYSLDKEDTMVCRYELMYTRNGYDYWRIIVGLLFNEVLIPVSIMTPLYARIVCLSRNQRKIMQQFQGGVSRYHEQEMMRREIRLAKMAAFLLCYFIFSWLPLIMYIAFAANDEESGSDELKFIRAGTRLLSFTNAAVNVFVYAGRNKDFRKAFNKDLDRIKSLFRKCKCHCPVSMKTRNIPQEVQQQEEPSKNSVPRVFVVNIEEISHHSSSKMRESGYKVNVEERVATVACLSTHCSTASEKYTVTYL